MLVLKRNIATGLFFLHPIRECLYQVVEVGVQVNFDIGVAVGEPLGTVLVDRVIESFSRPNTRRIAVFIC
ncbi:hypothetical protein WT10_00370 [Burkholderia stagnalis]|nr:hypothetical protein WS59_11845 [Burkholderia stagnalis]KVN24151.1 hypothetical protein WT10_00370 [Burkholderia stagnalis]KWK59448.1 hypothetical protein WT82_31685 [Burkholderia stagnalis]